MSNVTPFPSNTTRGRELISNMNHIRPGASYIVTTQRGSAYRIRLNPNPPRDEGVDLSRTHLLVSKDGAKEHPQYSAAVVREGEEWEIHPGHKTSPIVSVTLA